MTAVNCINQINAKWQNNFQGCFIREAVYTGAQEVASFLNENGEDQFIRLNELYACAEQYYPKQLPFYLAILSGAKNLQPPWPANCFNRKHVAAKHLNDIAHIIDSIIQLFSPVGCISKLSSEALNADDIQQLKELVAFKARYLGNDANSTQQERAWLLKVLFQKKHLRLAWQHMVAFWQNPWHLINEDSEIDAHLAQYLADAINLQSYQNLAFREEARLLLCIALQHFPQHQDRSLWQELVQLFTHAVIVQKPQPITQDDPATVPLLVDQEITQPDSTSEGAHARAFAAAIGQYQHQAQTFEGTAKAAADMWLQWMRDYLTTPIKVGKKPLSQAAQSHVFIEAMQLLDEIVGNSRAKNDILTEFSVFLKGKTTKTILAFYGPPGNGKTSLAYAAAKTFNLSCLEEKETKLQADSYRLLHLNFGNTSQIEQLCGTPMSLVGSQPGILVRSMILHRSRNLTVILDEIDKAPAQLQNVIATLLESQDPFTDHYFNLPIDTSAISWIVIYNDASLLVPHLKNRLDSTSIYVDKLNVDDIIEVGKRHLQAGLKAMALQVTMLPFETYQALKTYIKQQAIIDNDPNLLGRPLVQRLYKVGRAATAYQLPQHNGTPIIMPLFLLLQLSENPVYYHEASASYWCAAVHFIDKINNQPLVWGPMKQGDSCLTVTAKNLENHLEFQFDNCSLDEKSYANWEFDLGWYIYPSFLAADQSLRYFSSLLTQPTDRLPDGSSRSAIALLLQKKIKIPHNGTESIKIDKNSQIYQIILNLHCHYFSEHKVLVFVLRPSVSSVSKWI